MHVVQVKKNSKYKTNKDKVNNNYKTAVKNSFICDPNILLCAMCKLLLGYTCKWKTNEYNS